MYAYAIVGEVCSLKLEVVMEKTNFFVNHFKPSITDIVTFICWKVNQPSSQKKKSCGEVTSDEKPICNIS